MIRMVQVGIGHPHATAYRGTLHLMRDRIEVVGFVRAEGDRPDVDLELFPDVPVFTSVEEMLEAVQPDAAQVMLYNKDMAPVMEQLAEAGVHLWAEKPVARRAADLGTVAETVRRNNLVFTAGYQSRFSATTLYVRQLVRNGILGPLTLAHMTTATTTVQVRNPAGPSAHLFDSEISGGGIFHWLGCHMVDLLLTITEAEPVSVHGMTATAGEAQVEVEDLAAASIKFSDGWLASLNYGYLLPTRDPNPFGDDSPEPAIYGRDGWVRWNQAGDVARAYSRTQRFRESPWQMKRFATPKPGGYGDAALQAMTNFADAIDGVAEPVYTIDQAMLVLQIIESVYDSARLEQDVQLPTDVSKAFKFTATG